MSLYINERPHLDIWAREQEEERRLKELEAEEEKAEIRRMKIMEIKEHELQRHLEHQAVYFIISFFLS